jgi:SAM-dependent methyltransferase
VPADPFPPGFFDRADPSPDAAFYSWPRLVTHIDAGAIAAVGALYAELGITGGVLDLMGSWVSHFDRAPTHLTVLGMNAAELRANPQAAGGVVHDLNRTPTLPFAAESFDAVVCCVSVDYLTRPVEVFTDVARVLRPGGPFVCTFSNRCFPTRAIRGWLATDDAQHCEIVATYFRLAPGWDEPVASRRTPPGHRGDPLYAVWAHRSQTAFPHRVRPGGSRGTPRP